MFSIVIAILLLCFVVVIHELGHMFTARAVGIKVEKFSVGFGKRLFGFTDKKGTEWIFAPILLGGYVKMYGDDYKELEKADEKERKKMFLGQPYYKKVLVVLAGPLSNLLFGFLIVFSIYFINGIPTYKSVIDKSSIQFIQKGDKVVSINGVKIESANDFINYIRKQKLNEVTLTVDKNGNITDIVIPLALKNYNKLVDIYEYELPFTFSADTKYKQRFGFVDSINRSVVKTSNMVILMFRMVKGIATGEYLKEISGPAQVVDITSKAINKGVFQFLIIAFLINISLFVFNILPIPVLDGGHFMLFSIEALIGRTIPEKVLKVVLSFGISIILIVYLIAFYNDFRIYAPKVKQAIEQKIG